jgi:hypothetical protein
MIGRPALIMEVPSMLANPICILEEYLPEALFYYQDLIRGDNPAAFTRSSKVSTTDLLLQMLNRQGHSQWAEVKEYYGFMNAKTDITEKGFFLARRKFNPEAVHVMANEYIANIYDNYDDSIDKWNGLVILATDGSRVTLPSTKLNEQMFGKHQSKKDNTNEPVQALMSTLHDTMNNLKLDLQIDRIDGNEHVLAAKHIENYHRNYSQKAVFTYDRGYVSIRLIDQIINAGHYFLMRAKRNDFVRYFEQVKTGEDKELDVTYDRSTTNEYRGDRAFRIHLMNTTFHLRFTKIVIGQDDDGNDIVEWLISNLPMDLFDTDSLKDLYKCRWTIETSYNHMKNKMKLEEFSGYSPELILQDIYADMWMYNLVSLKIMEANQNEPIEDGKGEYTVRRNFNKAIGTLKTLLLKALMSESPYERQKIMVSIDTTISNSLTWVKKEARSFERKHAVNKSDMSYRKTF